MNSGLRYSACDAPCRRARALRRIFRQLQVELHLAGLMAGRDVAVDPVGLRHHLAAARDLLGRQHVGIWTIMAKLRPDGTASAELIRAARKAEQPVGSAAQALVRYLKNPARPDWLDRPPVFKPHAVRQGRPAAGSGDRVALVILREVQFVGQVVDVELQGRVLGDLVARHQIDLPVFRHIGGIGGVDEGVRRVGGAASDRPFRGHIVGRPDREVVRRRVR